MRCDREPEPSLPNSQPASLHHYYKAFEKGTANKTDIRTTPEIREFTLTNEYWHCEHMCA